MSYTNPSHTTDYNNHTNNNLNNDLNNNNLHNNNNFNTYGTSTTTTATVVKTEPSLMDKTKEKLIVAKDATKVKAHQLGEKIDNAMHQHKNCKNKHEHHPGGAHTRTTVADTHTQHHNIAGGGTTHDQYTQENRSFGNDHKTVDTTIQRHEHQ